MPNTKRTCIRKKAENMENMTQVIQWKNRRQRRRLNSHYLTLSERKSTSISNRVEEAAESLRAFHANVISRKRRNELANIGNMRRNLNEVIKLNEVSLVLCTP